MAKYSPRYAREENKNGINKVHPIWRGIGFAFIVLIPILSYFGAVLLINQNSVRQWVQIPKELLFDNLADPLLLVKILVTIVLVFLIAILFLAITFLFHSISAPSRYGPTDVPPIRYRRTINKR